MRGRERERRTHTLSRTQTQTHSRAEKTHPVGDYEAQSGPCTNTWLINLTSHTSHIHSWYKRDQKSRWASEDERGSRHQSRRKNGPVGSTCMWPDVEEGVCRQLFGVGGGLWAPWTQQPQPQKILSALFTGKLWLPGHAKPCRRLTRPPSLPYHTLMHKCTHPHTHARLSLSLPWFSAYFTAYMKEWLTKGKDIFGLF